MIPSTRLNEILELARDVTNAAKPHELVELIEEVKHLRARNQELHTEKHARSILKSVSVGENASEYGSLPWFLGYLRGMALACRANQQLYSGSGAFSHAEEVLRLEVIK